MPERVRGDPVEATVRRTVFAASGGSGILSATVAVPLSQLAMLAWLIPGLAAVYAALLSIVAVRAAWTVGDQHAAAIAVLRLLLPWSVLALAAKRWRS
jgi:hypothetical protein